MTRKDYEKIASVFQNMKRKFQNYCSTIESIENDMVTVLKQDNPRFDDKRFKEACKP